jgi:hypothetical protein
VKRFPRRVASGAIAIVVAALIIRQIVIGVGDYRMWVASANDPSARDFFFTSLEIDVALILLYVLFGWVLLYVIRRSSANAQPESVGTVR